MPKNLTGNPAVFPTQTTPLASEPRTAGSAEAPFQNAADRSEYLKDRLLFIDPNREGVRRQRRFVSVAEMKASVDMPDKSVALIDGVGLYQYDAASALVEASPAIITPTSVGAGAGRWLAIWLGSFNVANGIPQLDATGKLPTSRLAAGDVDGRIAAGTAHWSVVDIKSTFVGPTADSASGSLVDVPTASVILAAKAGDYIEASVTCISCNTVPGASRIALVVVKPDASSSIVGGPNFNGNSTTFFEPHHISTMVPVGLDGNHTVKLQHSTSGTGGAARTGDVTIVAKLWRP
jgi:hypothetical protein